MDENKAENGFGVWAILELMGHVKVAGYVTEEELFGTKIGRIDIPADEESDAITQYFGGASVYRLTPVSEDVARAFARRSRPRPVHVYELQPPRDVSETSYGPGDYGEFGDEGPDSPHEEEDWF